jgi:cytosine/adenosine deaminase-related metal-dependent hydrolase/ubiquinone/menaquinone biosynthesis C-methylase UbiE
VSAIAEFSSSTQNADVFTAWAEVYDRQPNPLLPLEERYLTCLLPRIQGKDVVDIGCGTGRWLQRLAVGRPASLRGMDSSPEMLQVAAGKGFQSTQLIQAKLPALPIVADSVDLELCSFVLSYVQDLALCASELARVIRHGGDLLLSDMHPSTAASLGWKRGFGAAGLTHLVQTNQLTIEELLDTFSANGFELAACLEPPFGKTEREIFEMNGKQAAWDQAAGMPAIYILHFRRVRQAKTTPHNVGLHSAYCALGPNELIAASVSIEEGKVSSISSPAVSLRSYRAVNDSSIDLSGYLLLPGLINAHDHLEFALFPRLGSPPYRNATQWAAAIQANESKTIARHKRIPKDIRLWWGGIRNLLCGATTVCHHNPLDPVLQGEDFPVHVVAHYGWEHSPAFAKDVSGALQSTGADEPFLIHACEGIDEEASQELCALKALHAIEQRSVLIHCLALNRTGIALLNEHGASLVICPSSNQFLFAKTHTREALLSVERLALGSDSPLTATGDLLDELRFAKSACDLHAEELYPMITRQAANVLRLRRGEGVLRPDSMADLVAVHHRPGTPAEILTELSWRDVELVIVGGRVHLASVNIMDRLPEEMKNDLTLLAVEGELRWLRGPVNTMLQGAERVLGKDNVRLGGLQISAV